MVSKYPGQNHARHVRGGVVHPALAWLVDERERAEPADPLGRRRRAERAQRVGDRDRSRLGGTMPVRRV
jgi:hypothetical protein